MNKENGKQPKRHEYSQAEIDFPAEVERVLSTIPPLTDHLIFIDNSSISIKQLAYHTLSYAKKKPKQFELWIFSPNKIEDQSKPQFNVKYDLLQFLKNKNIDRKTYNLFHEGTFLVDHQNNRYLQFDYEEFISLETYCDESYFLPLCKKYHLKGIISNDESLYIYEHSNPALIAEEIKTSPRK